MQFLEKIENGSMLQFMNIWNTPGAATNMGKKIFPILFLVNLEAGLVQGFLSIHVCLLFLCKTV